MMRDGVNAFACKLYSNTTACKRLKLPIKVKMQHHRVQTVAGIADQAAWRSLGTPQSQLLLHNTLPTGQSFRWRLTAAPDTYTGVIGQRVVQLRQLLDDVQWRVLARGPGASPEADAAALREYFNLDAADLAVLYSEWCSRDARFAAVSPHLPGARMLRQDPVECLFEFICSSNNHISRIHGMQLSAATEEALRAAGFGYRAKFIVGSVQQLLSQPGGGEAWLLGLRDKPYAEAHEALCSLPGVGPKVAACICLFSLDKHDAIPVDTHVWDLATRYYAPQLAKKTLNKQLHADIQAMFVQRFGAQAWRPTGAGAESA
ncbi:hypothetical protein OEZ86_012079 [Tetradesmus obliquus]|nr:hypothetical protein OEZ86_012079 [Tetradesmus obliquus]